MHIDPTTHEHGSSGKVYHYEGHFDVGQTAITWQATVSQAGTNQYEISGRIPLSSPAIASLAPQIVRDAIVQGIDRIVDTAHTGTIPAGPPGASPTASLRSVR